MSLRIAAVALLTCVGACGEPSPDDEGAEGGRPAATLGPDAGAGYCLQEFDFLSLPQRCTADGECVIAGSCSGTFGFRAVHFENRERAQAFADYRGCQASFDGPTYGAVCEQGMCVARQDGRACGMRSDGGSVGCAAGMVMYQVASPVTDTLERASCEERCLDATDWCGADKACTQVKVAPASGSGARIDVWLCRPTAL